MNVEWFFLIGVVLAVGGSVAFFLRDDLSLFGLTLAILAFIGILVFGSIAITRRGCDVFADANGLRSRYTVAAGCLVELEPGLWLSPDIIRSDGGLTIDTEEPS